MNNSADSYDKCPISSNPGADLFKFITCGVLLNLIGFLGIFGNIISMIILSRPQMKSSINYLLIGLAKCDTAVILTSILLFGLPSIYPYTGYLFTYYYIVYPHMAFVLFPLALIAQTASVYLTLTVTLERYVAVCIPLRARSLCTYGRARIYVLVILIFATVYNLPRFWETELLERVYTEYNVTVYCAWASDLRAEPLYVSIYVHWMYLIFLYFIPFVGLMILNLSIYRQVRKANRERQRLSRHQRREIGLATMLMCVVLVFFICNIFPLIVNIMEYFYNIIIDELIDASNLLITINSSVNFIIYVIFGEKFKRLFLRLFCSHGYFGHGPGRESPDGGTHDDSLMSVGDRQSLRLNRQNTTITRNGVSIRLNGTADASDRRSVRNRPPSPGPCVYYPASRSVGKEECIVQTQTTIVNSDWEQEHDNNTTGF